MYKIYFLGSLLLLSLQALAQCPTGDQSFYNQTDVNDFLADYPDCEELPGRVLIEGSGITNLNGFKNLTYIDGVLRIAETGLGDLTGLDWVFRRS
ncbi:hypothetical protein DYBT9275_05836 [Dyadobacter sp. CECT 9275]|uniref:Receptor L-domain domain-containing protein n=1 Tax=Dyadobacter helix TaxID=2822344 RepID=A0A916JIZ5_9BACT|nr:hypothetical protein [Dyadobacter sp. CECT 9275]CAG5017736.1 hypothetical protein DYBT9275_05836 [Dyadobacter sp. CECT 9275]